MAVMSAVVKSLPRYVSGRFSMSKSRTRSFLRRRSGSTQLLLDDARDLLDLAGRQLEDLALKKRGLELRLQRHERAVLRALDGVRRREADDVLDRSPHLVPCEIGFGLFYDSGYVNLSSSCCTRAVPRERCSRSRNRR